MAFNSFNIKESRFKDVLFGEPKKACTAALAASRQIATSNLKHISEVE